MNAFLDSDEDYPIKNSNQTDFLHTKPIVIDPDHNKYDKFDVDSANHSFDDGIDVVDGLIKPNINGSDYDKNQKIQKKVQGNSVDSGISNNMNSNGINGSENGHNESKENGEKALPSRLSDLSLKESDNANSTSSDEDRLESDADVSPRMKKAHSKSTEKKNGVSLNLKLQNEMR